MTELYSSLGRTRANLLLGNMLFTGLLVIAFALGLIELVVLIGLLLLIDGVFLYLWLRNPPSIGGGDQPPGS